ncbi:hypothetical protein LX81_03773 [Palleronia aestuarii]|uniref:Uncharacterized protein n=1 Tax=Palleronia aestuarii TaxID=568105 RepID=A0A2W7N0D8_9RHOB|nr:hypothetical protein [Palleronia aestuarii]PZX11897.1 hypothetical protein LX81_03773 [Palleronia aestuarii]
MNHVTQMIKNAAVILLATMLLTEIRHRFSKAPLTKGVQLGAMFALAGAVVMNNSVELVQGTRTDPWLAVATLAATFGGPVSAVIMAKALTGLRLSYGGLGAVPGQRASRRWPCSRPWSGGGGKCISGVQPIRPI